MINFTDEDEIQSAFEHYRKLGFPYPKLTKYEIIHSFLKLQLSTAKINKQKRILSIDNHIKTIEIQPVGDIDLINNFHPHIWKSHAVGMKSPIESFNNDKKLKRIFMLCLKYTGEINDKNVTVFSRLVSGTQPCANFRPSAAKAVYDYFKCNSVLDMSMGYGGRLMGFLASKSSGSYIGIDPSPKSCNGNQKIVEMFNVNNRVKIIESPFENVDETLLNKSELAFTSPPYFLKEIYDENEESKKLQSRERYPTYKLWKNNFLYPMVIKTRKLLKNNGIMAINIQDVTLHNKHFPLSEDIIKISLCEGFKHIETLYLKFAGFGKNLKKVKTEPIFVFRKI